MIILCTKGGVEMNNREKVIIIGAGPCGLAAALALQKKGINPLVIEKGNVVDAIARYPIHQQFFSSSEKLEIGDIPFYSVERKPKRNEALVYYREVVKRKKVRVNAYERVTGVYKDEASLFVVNTVDNHGVENKYVCNRLIVATGYYDSPNMLHIPGEEQNHVFHYFKEAHPYFNQHVVVIGGKNSAVDAALELQKVGAKVTLLYRGNQYSESIKPWILPELDSLVKNGEIEFHFKAAVKQILKDKVVYEVLGETSYVKADFVFAMTGYHPDHSLLEGMGVSVDCVTGRPDFDPDTMETNCSGIFIAGVIAAGNNANEIFIENGRFHGELIATKIVKDLNN